MKMKGTLQRIVVTVQIDVTGGPSFGTSYDLTNSCPVCGTGAIPVGPRLLRLKRPPSLDIFQTLDGEILVSNALAERLRAVANGVLFEVRDATSREVLPFLEIRAQALLPPFAPSTEGFERERPCNICQRDGYFEIPNVGLHLVFPPLDQAAKLANVLATYERFGNSKLRTPFADSVLARPLFLFSSALADVLRTSTVSGVSFEAVSFD
jgi:hypothetical protein